MYAGDIRLGDTLDVAFTTVNSSGAPTALSGGTVAAYVGNSTTEIAAGITLTADLDTRTGYNNVRIVATSGNGYATATNVRLVLTAGTVGGTSVVGYCVGSFSIEARSALMPVTAGRTLDVTAASKVNGVVLTDTLTTYTGNTVQTGDAFARLGAPAGASVSADVAAVKADTANIYATVDTEVAAILAAVDTEVAAILALLDDPRTEPGQGAPAVNPDAVTKIDYLYKAFRNKVTQTATTLSIYADDGTTVDHKSTVSDDATTYTRGELATGP